MFKHFQFIPFIVGVILGLLGFYISNPDKTVIYKYPNPQNAGKLIYKDKNDMCYTYTTEKTDCDSNQNKMKTYPLL